MARSISSSPLFLPSYLFFHDVNSSKTKKGEMKSSFKKLRGFATRQDHAKDRRDRRRFTSSDELDQAAKDMNDMRDCYDSLVAAAAATANSTFEFSESLREMGSCLLEKTALNDDEDSGRVLLELGKVLYKLQNFVDIYRSHIFQTITAPSESLLNELQTVEEMKQQCDEKRHVYEYMKARQRERGQGKGGKTESFSKQQLQTAHDEYDEEATLFVFRLKSLKQGQSRSLLTQAARHHAAQVRFFRKALKSLEDIEPLVKTVTEQQHIDYHFSGLEYMDEDDNDDSSDSLGGGESSVDYKQNDQDQYISKPRNSMEENLNTSYWKPFSLRGETTDVNYSEPIIAKNEHDSVDAIKQTWRTYRRKFNTYALPLPNTAGSKSLNSGGPVVLPQTLKSSSERANHNVLQRPPFDPGRKHPEYTIRNPESVLKESYKGAAHWNAPFPAHLDPRANSESREVRRQFFSGPSTSQAWLMEPTSAQLLQNPTTLLLSSSPKVSPKASPTTSPTLVSSPKTSQLHELPRPPTTESSRPVGRIGHSNQLKHSYNPPALNIPELNRTYSVLTPMHFISRSLSVPYNGSRAMAMSIVEQQEAAQKSEVFEYTVLSPVTPVSTPKMRSP